MTTQKESNVRFIALSSYVLVLSIVIDLVRGLFSSPEYYKGFDWNTIKRKLEWRLTKDHYWYNEEEIQQLNATSRRVPRYKYLVSRFLFY